jgi:vacuolar-type H+-ATPase subunit C/Vma6
MTKQKIEFTREQLKEVEKLFDIEASLLSGAYANLFNSINKVEGSEKILIKLLKEYSDAFDMYRTISAKASAMEKEL